MPTIPYQQVASLLTTSQPDASPMANVAYLDHQELEASQQMSIEHWILFGNQSALMHALIASFSVIMVSELGDKTFIITAILAMKNSRLMVFLASSVALYLMTVLSVGIGMAVTVIPKIYTHYISIVLFLYFGLKMLKEAYDMTYNSEGDECEFDEVERSLEQEERDNQQESSTNNEDPTLSSSSSEKAQPAPQGGASKAVPAKNADPNSSWYARLAKSVFVTPIMIKIFTMIFVAEWGDRSQMSTVILAAREDWVGVFVGSFLGHAVCTGLAVMGGRFVADMISVRNMTFIGAMIFLSFAAFAIIGGC